VKNDFNKNIPISDWPGPDRRTWEIALQRGSILDNPGGLSHLRAGSIELYKSSYGRWLGFLSSHALSTAADSGIDRLSPDLLRDYVAMLRSNLAPSTVAYSVGQLGRVAQLFEPERDWKFIRTTLRQLYRDAKQSRDPPRPYKSSIELYNLGVKIMSIAEAHSTPIRRAIEFRSGLIISFLAARPLRRRNLAMIVLNRHLQLHGEVYWVHFEPGEIKNRRPFNFPWPDALHGALIGYLKVHRPVLLNVYSKHELQDDRLWAVGYDGLGRIITTKTAQWSGQSINPHRFRHAAATSTAIEDSAHVGIVTAILGHSTSKTAELYYNKATSVEAARRYQKHISTLQRTPSRR
jgi:integrase